MRRRSHQEAEQLKPHEPGSTGGFPDYSFSADPSGLKHYGWPPWGLVARRHDRCAPGERLPHLDVRSQALLSSALTKVSAEPHTIRTHSTDTLYGSGSETRP